GIESGRLYSDDTYIGDAVLVEGARPDVEAAYPTNPNNYKAGWGYMMLTNFLPGGGNGGYTITAIATDMEGKQTTLGSKTITVDNTNAVKPFGAIDTPVQGGTVSGPYRNQGWVLTPLPNTIPIDGSTINVFVDGHDLGHPVYNQPREDIAGYFPENNNSSGPGAYLDIDTTAYANGIHTIYWVATDDAGNVDGIGSRFFTIQNSGSSRQPAGAQSLQTDNYCESGGLLSNTVSVLNRVGYGAKVPFTPVVASKDGEMAITLNETKKLELKFDPASIVNGYIHSDSKQGTLPIGSSIKGGQFSWIPVAGFSGEYRMTFLLKEKNGTLSRSTILLRILPKFSLINE
ncbi:MAG: hypothetical protein GY757_57975, partial [bacterium]|nr:hypothetical protein [bacterium]